MSHPAGIIALWSGAIGNIPVGWALCNGGAGTPDLRDRFIIGAGDSFNPGDTGGATTHTHTFTGDGHSHNFPVGSGLQTGADRDFESSEVPATGTTDPGNSLPTFYALAYIMKL